MATWITHLMIADRVLEVVIWEFCQEIIECDAEKVEDKYIGAKISFVGIPIGNGISSFGDDKKYRNVLGIEKKMQEGEVAKQQISMRKRR